MAPVAAQPSLELLKAQLQDIETDLKMQNVDDKLKTGQEHRAEGEAIWNQGSSSDRDKNKSNRGGGGRGSGGGRGVCSP